jgi:hypothetical protein
VKARKLSAVLLTLVALVTGFFLIAGVANAAPPDPTTPYPSVAIDVNVCKTAGLKVAKAQLAYNQAVSNYNYAVAQLNKNVGSIADVRAKQTAADNAGIVLNDLNYAQATCQNNAANPDNKACKNFALELNRLLDKLAITQDLQAIAQANYNDATTSFKNFLISANDYEQITTTYKMAVLQTQIEQQEITDLRGTRPAGCNLSDRLPTAPPPHVPTSTDAPPTDTATASALPSDSASDTTTSPDPVPSSAAPSDTTSTGPGSTPSAS